MPCIATLVWRVALAGCLLPTVACGDDLTGPQTPIEVTHMPGLQGFEAQLDSLRVELQIPGLSAAIVDDRQIVWSKGFGYSDVDAERPAQPTDPFHLASLTKTFAATIVMQLVEAGLVDLDDPVSDYGIELESQGVVRVRHIMTHTSEGVPGSHYSYNGDRFGRLDRVIEGASNRTFGELLVERILQPLGLTSTAPNVRQPLAFALTGLDRDAFVARMAKPYELEDDAVVRSQYPSYFGTAAGLIASAEDVARYSIAIDRGQFLEPETWDSVFTPSRSNTGDTLPYGLGWFIYTYQGVKLEWHYGSWTANSSLIVRAPVKGLTFVVLANTGMLSRAYGLGIDANVMRSDVARLFVESFVIGDEPLP